MGRAEAGAELSHLRVVQEAAKDVKNWRASTWWLERRAPDRYGPRGAGVVTARQLKAYIAILANVIRGGDQGEMDAAQVITRLKSFSESVDQLLRNERMLAPDPIDMFDIDEQKCADDIDTMTDDRSGDHELGA